MDYNTYVTTIANLLVIPPTDPNYVQILPSIISDASQRIRRDLDLISDVVRDQTGTLTANSRNFTFPQHFVVSESVNIFTPSGTTTNRNQLVPVTREFLDAIWPNEASTTTPSVPQYYAMITDQQIIVGPPPDATYTMEVIGTIIPPDLSSTQTTTWISLYLPDVLVAASMVFGIAYIKDYGAAVDDPNAAGSWETKYQKLMVGANTEENRKKYASQAWTPKQPAPFATPPRA